MFPAGQVVTTPSTNFNEIDYGTNSLCKERFTSTADLTCSVGVTDLYQDHAAGLTAQQKTIFDGWFHYAIARTLDNCLATVNQTTLNGGGTFDSTFGARYQCTLQAVQGVAITALLGDTTPVEFQGTLYTLHDAIELARTMALAGQAVTEWPEGIAVPEEVMVAIREVAMVSGQFDPLINDWVINLYREAMMQRPLAERENIDIQTKVGLEVVKRVKEHITGSTFDEVKAFKRWLSMAFVDNVVKNADNTFTVTLMQMPETIIDAQHLALAGAIDAATTNDALNEVLIGIYELRKFFAPQVLQQIRIDEANSGLVPGHEATLSGATRDTYLDGIRTQTIAKLFDPVVARLRENGGVTAAGQVDITKMAGILRKYHAIADYTVTDNGATVTVNSISLVDGMIGEFEVPEALMNALDGYSDTRRYYAIRRLWGETLNNIEDAGGAEAARAAAQPGATQMAYVTSLVGQLTDPQTGEPVETEPLMLSYIISADPAQRTVEVGHAPATILHPPEDSSFYQLNDAAESVALGLLLRLFEAARQHLPTDQQNDPATLAQLAQSLPGAVIHDSDDATPDQTLSQVVNEQAAPIGSPPDTLYGIGRLYFMDVSDVQMGSGAAGTANALSITITETGPRGGECVDCPDCQDPGNIPLGDGEHFIWHFSASGSGNAGTEGWGGEIEVNGGIGYAWDKWALNILSFRVAGAGQQDYLTANDMAVMQLIAGDSGAFALEALNAGFIIYLTDPVEDKPRGMFMMNGGIIQYVGDPIAGGEIAVAYPVADGALTLYAGAGIGRTASIGLLPVDEAGWGEASSEQQTELGDFGGGGRLGMNGSFLNDNLTLKLDLRGSGATDDTGSFQAQGSISGNPIEHMEIGLTLTGAMAWRAHQPTELWRIKVDAYGQYLWQVHNDPNNDAYDVSIGPKITFSYTGRHGDVSWTEPDTGDTFDLGVGYDAMSLCAGPALEVGAFNAGLMGCVHFIDNAGDNADEYNVGGSGNLFFAVEFDDSQWFLR